MSSTLYGSLHSVLYIYIYFIVHLYAFSGSKINVYLDVALQTDIQNFRKQKSVLHLLKCPALSFVEKGTGNLKKAFDNFSKDLRHVDSSCW